MVGINVARKFCRNRYMTRNTSAIPSNKVFTTSVMEISTKGVVSYGKLVARLSGKNDSNSAKRAFTAFAVSNAFAPDASVIARPAAGLRLKRPATSYDSEPSSIRATSESVTCEPSDVTFNRMRPNSSGVSSSVCTTIEAFICCPSMAGVPPS